jgi:hypothetical protein
MIAKDPQNPLRRLLLLAKCNIAPDEGGLAYSIIDGAIAFEPDAVLESADDVLAAENGANSDGKPGPEPVARNAAVEWLRAELADYAEHPVPSLRENAKAAGMGWRTVERASAELRVRSHRATFGGGYVWRLPKPGADENDASLPAIMLATSQESERTRQPGEQGKALRKTADSARQVPLPAKSVCSGEQGAESTLEDKYDRIEREAVQEAGM